MTQHPQQLMFAFDQRWQGRREFRHGPGETINAREYGIEILRERDAKAFVIEHHYSASYPAAHCAVGLLRKHGVAPARLAGVAVFSEGIQSGSGMPRWTGFPAAAGTELGRLCLLPEVPYNGESWFIRRAFAALRAERAKTRVVLSYADPTERTTTSGQRVKAGHVGTIYQASNALFLGRAAGRILHLWPDGRVLQPYNFHKFLHRRSGWRAAGRLIADAGQAAGCSPRGESEDDSAWVARVKAALRTLRHPGNFAYAFGLDADAWQQLRGLHGTGQPYPKAAHLPSALKQ